LSTNTNVFFPASTRELETNIIKKRPATLACTSMFSADVVYLVPH